MTLRRLMTIGPLAAALMCGTVGMGAQRPAPDLQGVWRLIEYTGPLSVGPASGLLVFADDHFSLVYTMRPAKAPTSGRAHAGRYRVEGATIRLDLDWSLEYVSGKGDVAPEPFSVSPALSVEGDLLTLSFEGGGVQRFRRSRPGGPAVAALQCEGRCQ
jgi:hypothetical protein